MQDMLMLPQIVWLAVIVLPLALPMKSAGADQAVIVGLTKQLFFDDHVIDAMPGLVRTVHPADKHEANPVIIPDRPWENSVHHPAAVVYNPHLRRYEMWYHSARIPQTILDIAFAYSEDGIHWVKPVFDDPPPMWRVNYLHEIDESTKYTGRPGNAQRIKDFHAALTGTNLVLASQELQGVVYRPDAADPDERYVSSIFGGTLITSPDGIHWTRRNTYYPGQNNTFNYDPARGLFFGYFLYPPYGIKAYDGTTRRVLGFSCSRDLVHWTGSSPDDIKVALPLSPAEIDGSYRGAPLRGKPVSTVEVVIVPDEEDDERATQWLRENKDACGLTEPIKGRGHFNGFGVFPYEGVYIGFPVKLSALADHPQFKDELHRPSGIELAFSRDLREWKRFRQWIVPYGPTGAWDHNELLPANRPMIVGDEVWLYYGGYFYDRQGEMWGYYGLSSEPAPGGDWQGYMDMDRRGLMWNLGYEEPVEVTERLRRVAAKQAPAPCGIGIAKWRLDGFVSLDGGTAGGELITKPLVFSGTELEINADASAAGSIAVELQGADGAPLDGYQLADCDALRKDAVHHRVTWRGRGDVTQLAGHDVRLRFVLTNARLYAFHFVGAGPRVGG